MSFAPGTRIGPYEVVASIGEGGMGQVYRARDAKLGRDVALKVLPDAFVADPDRRLRFEREARTLASLNHPNIAAIYGVEESAHALVMELVEGEDLAARLSRGALPPDDALGLARQIADALEAAHDQGVVHRDLKPANIKVRPDGTVKVLDFGLAKALSADGGSAASGQSPAALPTMTSPAMTAMGVILGTAAYMSPEQARGRAVDRRADLWAFGVILFEMLTGKQMFAGDSITDVLAAVVKEEPSWDALPPDTPPAIQRLLRRCLQKDPKRRLRDAADARLDLEDAIAGAGHEVAAVAAGDAANTRRRGAGSAWLWAASVGGALAIGGAAVWLLMPAPDLPVRRFSIQPPDRRLVVEAVIAPDGRAVAFMAGEKAWVQRLDRNEPVELPGATGGRSLFWSPDSSQVGYQARGRLWKTVIGSSPVEIAPVNREFSQAAGVAWLSDDRIWYTSGGSGIFEVSAQGGAPRVVLEPDAATEVDLHDVRALPDGRSVLFVPHLVRGTNSSVDLFDGQKRVTLFKASDTVSQPTYSPSGHLLFFMSQGVWAVKFSLKDRQITGEPFLIAADAGRPSVSADGTLVVVPAGSSADQQLTWVDRQGAVTGALGRGGIALRNPRISPDGRQVVVSIAGANPDLHVFDMQRGTDRRLTFEDGVDSSAVWSSDGRFIIYQCGSAVCSRPADGSGSRVVLVPEPAVAPAVSPDGQYLIFGREQAVSGRDLFIVRMGPAGFAAAPADAPRPFLVAPGIQGRVDLSPDGTLAAYESRETGEDEVYVTNFPSGQGKWQISRNAGQAPRWNQAGTRLSFRAADRIVEVPIDRTPTPSAGEAVSLVNGPAIGARITAFGYDRAGDDSRFLVVRPSSGVADIGSFWLVEQWAREHVKK